MPPRPGGAAVPVLRLLAVDGMLAGYQRRRLGRGQPPDARAGAHGGPYRDGDVHRCQHNGVDIHAPAAYLGHSDPGFTLRTYVHLMPSADDRVRQAVDTDFALWEKEMSHGP